MEGPVLLHVITKKGKGYSPAEDDKIGTWHGTGLIKLKQVILLNHHQWHLHGVDLLLKQLVKLHVKINESLRLHQQCLLVRNLEAFAAEFPDRLFDVGIAEQHATTMAAGLATQGMKPFLGDLFNIFTTCI